jgi:Phage integrase, N-terminal SAM-like domain
MATTTIPATTPTISPLRQRMIDDMIARGLVAQTQKGPIRACKRFAAYLKRSPDTATAVDVRQFQLHLIESGLTIQNRNRTMTGVRFLLRVTMRRHDLAAEVFHIKEPTRIRRFHPAVTAVIQLPFADDGVIAAGAMGAHEPARPPPFDQRRSALRLSAIFGVQLRQAQPFLHLDWIARHEKPPL